MRKRKVTRTIPITNVLVTYVDTATNTPEIHTSVIEINGKITDDEKALQHAKKYSDIDNIVKAEVLDIVFKHYSMDEDKFIDLANETVTE